MSIFKNAKELWANENSRPSFLVSALKLLIIYLQFIFIFIYLFYFISFLFIFVFFLEK